MRNRISNCSPSTANLKNPFACREIIKALPAVLDRYGIETIRDIIGGAHG